jgi:hypothetical protein
MAAAAEIAEIVRQGPKLQYWENQKSQKEKLHWMMIAGANEAAHGRRIKPKNSLDDLK